MSSNVDYAVGVSANSAAYFGYAAMPFSAHGIQQVHCGYSDDPTSGSLVIQSGNTTIYTMPVVKAGAAPIVFNPPIYGSQNEYMQVTLSQGGSGVTGYLNIWHVTR